MRIGIATSNHNFIEGLLHELDQVRQHDLLMYQHTDDPVNLGYQIGRLCAQSETVFVDFAQDPLLHILTGYPGRIIVRAHRLEMYAAGIEAWPWDRVECLVFIADHVRTRFMERLTGARPQSVEVLPHVGVNTQLFAYKQRTWEPPYRILLAGNVIPKKRVYTAVQMLADMPEEVHLHVVGKCGVPGGYGNDEYGANITDIADELGLRGRVVYQDHVDHASLPALMQTCTWIGSWSNEEGCHTSVAEGMATGLIPLVSCWRGAETMYGADAIWRTPLSCYAKVRAFLEADVETRNALSLQATTHARGFDAALINHLLANIIEGSASASATYDRHAPTQVAQYGNPRQRRCYAILREHGDLIGPYLDIGCGIGYVVAMAAHDGAQAAGMDVSPALLKEAAYRATDAAQWVCGDVTVGMPQADQPWSTVSLFDSLEHIPTQARQDVLTRVYHALKPGGRLLLTFPWQGGDAAQPLEWPVYPKTVAQYLRACGMEKVMDGPLDDTYWLMVYAKPVTEEADAPCM